jgi:glycosyltransferase involved in cell wall biosynthesis
MSTLTVAYLANQYPAAVEPYVGEEVEELRRRGVKVIAGSVRKPDASQRPTSNSPAESEMLCLQPVCLLTLLRALLLAIARWERISDLLTRILLRGTESPMRRLKALLHTWLGAYYAVLLKERGVDHIHVHHGYFGSWIAMVAARLLDVGFSLTLHGSDLLLHGAYLDTKLHNCRFCLTISEYNRRYILRHFRDVEPRTIIVSRLGVDTELRTESPHRPARGRSGKFTLLAAGRLHAVKDHAFLIRACAQLRDHGLDFECLVAGEGPERQRLECLIRENRLQHRVKLLGHVARQEMDSLYRTADLFVLTSLSEGIPLVLMEAMALGTTVLAPAITGVPELVVPGRSGFLYQHGNLNDFVQRVLFLQSLMRGKDYPQNRLEWIRHAARVQILHNFDRQKNLTCIGGVFLQRIAAHNWSPPDEDPLLQQIQLPLQRY